METLQLAETASKELERLFQLQKENQYNVGNTTASQRIKKIKHFRDVLLSHKQEIYEALKNDYGKHPSEVDLSEIYPVTSEIKYTTGKLHKWLGKNPRPTPLAMLGATSRIKYEPKGVVLIISPWNFPINLTFGPMVSAIAAGNCVMIKPSEMTPNTSKLIRKIVSEAFDESEVCVVEGGIKTAEPLLTLPFNHIFFTGSPTVGKIVMAAAAKNLASVTLELGGKSPTIVDQTANLSLAAQRIAWGKYLNNGQVCIAPDYLLVHESKKDALIAEFKKVIKKFYNEDAANEPSYSRVVNSQHHDRLKGVLEDAFNKGANIVEGGVVEDKDNFISPTVITDAPMDARIMQEEIFGPLLPIITFKNIEEVTEIVNAKEKPLALYIYSKSRKNINYILNNTRAGGTCINHNAIHFFISSIGFGGSNNSGIGRGHGDEGFKAFSNPRGVVTQHIPNALDLLVPPYNGFKQKLIDFTIKWL